VKEYYGTRPDLPDPNLAMAKAVFAQPDITLPAALEQIAQQYSANAEPVIRAWYAASDALTIFPFDVCWQMRQKMDLSPFHPWDALYMEGHLVDTPSWCSTRRTVFMTTEHETDHHPWFIEDLALRWEVSIERTDEALGWYEKALASVAAERRDEIGRWITDLRSLRRVARRFELHAKETLAALHLRHAATPDMVQRLRALLEADAENQAGAAMPQGHVPARKMFAEFSLDPAAWVASHLLPRQTFCFW
jgi:hypothetical protein